MMIYKKHERIISVYVFLCSELVGSVRTPDQSTERGGKKFSKLDSRQFFLNRIAL